MHHGINLQQQFLGHKQKSQQLNGGEKWNELFLKFWTIQLYDTDEIY